MWTSPFHLRFADADWLLPMGIAAGTMFATDTETSKHLPNTKSRLNRFNTFSNGGAAAMGGIAGGLYLWGHMTHDDHKSETGFLAGEAALDSLAVVYPMKIAFGRERPLNDAYRGSFWHGGDSFPSEHAAAAWSIASVVAHEYPGPLTRALAYGLASAVSTARINSKQHFPSDVLIGSVIGWYAGERAYRAHHDPELGGEGWETYTETRDEGSAPETSSASRGTPYVELDSWVYPAIERLAALGYIHSQFLGMRPWTRQECVELLDEASEALEADQGPASSQAERLVAALEQEFREDSGDREGELGSGGGAPSFRVESVYTTITGIDGQPLNDSYHFGQTIINNYGRPYQEGFNTYDGISGYAAEGRFVVYARGEYQEVPSAPGYSQNVRNVIATVDANPVQPAAPFPAASQFRLLDAYAAAKVANWDLAFGKQSLWWGPEEGGALLFSDNAEPIYMFRASRIAPFNLPSVFSRLGPMKWDVFFGKLSGNQFPPRPLLHGEKISFKPTPNLEFGFTRTVEMGGVGRALTLGHLWLSYTSLTSPKNETPNTDPGKRNGGVDFSYRIPRMRDWLTIYADSLSPDDPSPLAGPQRSAINTGLYMPHLPGARKLDFRAEAGYTNTPTSVSTTGHFIYFDTFYHDLYTNKRNLIGSWIGREGMGFQGWTTYWFSPRSSLQFGYRHAKVAKDFIPQGETLDDGSVKMNWQVRSDLSFSAFVQYEKWVAPILEPGPQTNWTSSVECTFWPKAWSK